MRSWRVLNPLYVIFIPVIWGSTIFSTPILAKHLQEKGAPLGGEGAPTPRTVNAYRATSLQEANQMATENATQCGKYGAYMNCTQYALNFHLRCVRENRECRTVRAFCGDDAHRFNMIKLDDQKWYLLEPQGDGIKFPGFTNPQNPDSVALCNVMSTALKEDGKCPCLIFDISLKPLPQNRNPITACARNESLKDLPPSVDSYRKCDKCCIWNNKLYADNDYEGHEQWAKSCKDACKGHFLPKGTAVPSTEVPHRNLDSNIVFSRRCVAKAISPLFSDDPNYAKLTDCRNCCAEGLKTNAIGAKALNFCFGLCKSEFE